jgi:ribosomal protein L7/L12
MRVVKQIVDLFDELDGYESVELMEALAERGYELKINYELAKTTKRTKLGIYLKSFNDRYKITCIKVCRNYGPENSKSLDRFVVWGLREAKDFVEDQSRWDTTALFSGSKTEIMFHSEFLEKEYGPNVQFIVKEIL